MPICSAAGQSAASVSGGQLYVNSATNATFGGTIAGALAFTKQSTNTVTLSGTQDTFSGGMNVYNGTLRFENGALGSGTGIQLGTSSTGSVPVFDYVTAGAAPYDLSGRTLTLSATDANGVFGARIGNDSAILRRRCSSAR